MRSGLVKEATFVGGSLFVIGAALMQFDKKGITDKKYWPYLGVFIVGFSGHLIFEAFGLNKKYCETAFGEESFEASQYPSLKLTENQQSKLRWFMFAYEAHSINDSIYIDEELDDVSPKLWTQATTVGLPFTIEKNSRQGDDSAKKMQKRTLSQLVKKDIFEVNESFENKEVPFTINVKLTPKAKKAVMDDIDDLRSLVAESFEADSKEQARLKKYEKTYGKEGAKVRNRIFKRILANAQDGTKAGQWSARKAQSKSHEG